MLPVDVWRYLLFLVLAIDYSGGGGEVPFWWYIVRIVVTVVWFLEAVYLW
jgi:hypothetical protein